MKRLVMTTLIGLGAVALTACSTGRSAGTGGLPRTSADDYQSAQTYALPGQPGYRGNEYAFYKNAMTAPANQTYYFSFDSSQMRPIDLQAMRIQASYLATHPNARIRLEGNTDNRGSREYNIALGWRRDQAVARLLEQQGVRRSQIQMVSYGKEHPVVEGNNEKAWALNRRVNLVYKAQ
ncbi:MAG: peptidoglycan-associated lipoprotein Pal [Coxiellaceae bacterium]|nr:peptidoglycan-associated lipoprotein Pal [Coxiellaceae bacterium]